MAIDTPTNKAGKRKVRNLNLTYCTIDMDPFHIHRY